jgi:hypothetical protein
MPHRRFSRRLGPTGPRSRADFTALLHGSPALSLALNRSLGGRLQDARTAAPTARPRPATVALIALDGNIPLPRLAARLGAALEAHLSIAVLGGARGAGRGGARRTSRRLRAAAGPSRGRARPGSASWRTCLASRALDQVLPGDQTASRGRRAAGVPPARHGPRGRPYRGLPGARARVGQPSR